MSYSIAHFCDIQLSVVFSSVEFTTFVLKLLEGIVDVQNLSKFWNSC